MDLATLLDRTGLDVLEHLERQAAVPVVDAPQAQGDLLVVPADLLADVGADPADFRPVPPEGVELVRGLAGNNPHTLVADAGTCRLTTRVRDPLLLAVAYVENTAPVWLVHPEHGGTGIAPGRWVVRRQREAVDDRRRRGVWAASGGTMLVAD